MIQTLNTTLAWLSVGAQIFVAVAIVVALTKKPTLLLTLLQKYGLFLAFGTAIAGMLLSLMYSDVFGYAPCTLCWYQRIFLYPQVILLGMAIIVPDNKRLIDSSIILTILGAIVAISHHILQTTGLSLIPCASGGVSCSARFIYELGYITMPFMSLVSFLVILVGLYFSRKKTDETAAGAASF